MASYNINLKNSFNRLVMNMTQVVDFLVCSSAHIN